MILYTSELEQEERKTLRTGWIYIGFALFCLLFGFVYERFSHEVYSLAMLYAFVFPLFSGLAWLAAGMRGRGAQICGITADCCHMGVATCTVGSLFQGVLEIYGTTSRFVRVYWCVGIALLVAALVTALVPRRQGQGGTPPHP